MESNTYKTNKYNTSALVFWVLVLLTGYSLQANEVFWPGNSTLILDSEIPVEKYEYDGVTISSEPNGNNQVTSPFAQLIQGKRGKLHVDGNLYSYRIGLQVRVQRALNRLINNFDRHLVICLHGNIVK